jgi:hypothetical protein
MARALYVAALVVQIVSVLSVLDRKWPYVGYRGNRINSIGYALPKEAFLDAVPEKYGFLSPVMPRRTSEVNSSTIVGVGGEELF